MTRPQPFSRRAALAASIAVALTPAATLRAQTPEATPAVDQIALFAQQRDALAAQGRAVIDDFLAGNDEAFIARLSPELAGFFVSQPPSDFLDVIQTNRIQMTAPDFGAWFNAQYDGTGRMEGIFHQGVASVFILETDEPQTGNVPTGLWKGQIAPGQLALDIEVTFSGTPEALEASLTIPSQGITDQPLDDVAFISSMPIGELVQDRALPFGPAVNAYSAEYSWGDALLQLTANFDGSSVVTEFSTVVTLPLPPDPMAGYESSVEYRLPTGSQLFVFWGGETEFQNYHATAPTQRHALDLVVWENGATYSGTGARNEDYYIWGEQVVAPAAGTVVAAENGMPDFEPGQLLSSMDPAEQQGISPLGNHVIIQTDESEYVVIAHMQKGSVGVGVGDEVAAGDEVGLVGNSGNTSEPHIHIHVQTTVDVFDPQGIGLPVPYANYLADGVPVAEGAPVQGQFVTSQP